MTLTFRDVCDGHAIPRHCYHAYGGLDAAALLFWFCPSLTPEQAANLAALPDAPITETSVAGLRAFIVRNHR